MDHWRDVLPKERILEVRYEAIVEDIESEARRILDYCSIDWDDRCLSFHQTKRSVRTASAAQICRPLYANAVGRWHVYDELAGPLTEALRA